MKLSVSTLLAGILVLGISNHGLSADEKAKVTFIDDVLPILENRCNNCHNPDEAKGGLNLATFSATLTGGSGGEIVISEDPGSSRLFTLAAHTEEPIMPPKGTKMTEKELKIVSDWIAGGLLETKNSKARKSDKPKVDLNSISATGKPKVHLPCRSTSFSNLRFSPTDPTRFPLSPTVRGHLLLPWPARNRSCFITPKIMTFSEFSPTLRDSLRLSTFLPMAPTSHAVAAALVSRVMSLPGILKQGSEFSKSEKNTISFSGLTFLLT